jgi:type I restriction enzyme M protein
LFEQKHPKEKSKAPKLFGQELNPVTFAMAKMNMFLHDYTDSVFAIGDTFTKPGFAAEGAGLRRFDYVVANPMWNQDNYDETLYENDKWERFTFGVPYKASADWGWIQHIFASLNDQGKAAIVLDTGAVARGSGNKATHREKEIRRQFIESDLIEAVILLPENLFYNTTAPGILLLLNRAKSALRKGQFLVVNASSYFARETPKNKLTDKGIIAIADVYSQWESREKLSQVVTLEDARKSDYNLLPSYFVDVGDEIVHRPMQEIAMELSAAGLEREAADVALWRTLHGLGVDVKRGQR